MTFGEVYSTYHLMPILQEHMVRVAYVARTIAEHATVPTDTEVIVRACLLHDMGNIIKFNFDAIPDAVEPEGRAYWEKIKQDFISTYGDDEVEATHAICDELGISSKVRELVDAFGTRNVIALTASNDLNTMIVNYADHRVAPHGIVSLQERIADQNERIMASLDPEKAQAKLASRKPSNDAKFALEKHIFAKCDLRPEDIEDINVQTIMDEFLSVGTVTKT